MNSVTLVWESRDRVLRAAKNPGVRVSPGEQVCTKPDPKWVGNGPTGTHARIGIQRSFTMITWFRLTSVLKDELDGHHSYLREEETKAQED